MIRSAARKVVVWWFLWRGWWRLHYGFCPACNSSPPDAECPVCEGDREYWRGHDGWSGEKRDRWWREYRTVVEQ